MMVSLVLTNEIPQENSSSIDIYICMYIYINLTNPRSGPRLNKGSPCIYKYECIKKNRLAAMKD